MAMQVFTRGTCTMTTIDSRPSSNPAAPRTRRRFTPRDRQRLIRLYEKSGQRAGEFCRDHDVCVSSLRRWLAQAHQAREREEVDPSGLVEIPKGSLRAADARAAVTMQLTGGQRLEIVVGTDTVWIGALVRALTSAGA
jgi:transposase-like protein